MKVSLTLCHLHNMYLLKISKCDFFLNWKTQAALAYGNNFIRSSELLPFFFSVIIDAPSDPVLITLEKTSIKAVAIPLRVASLHSIFKVNRQSR